MNELNVNAVAKVDPGSGAARAYEMRGAPASERPAVEPLHGVQSTATRTQVQQAQAAQQSKPQAAEKPKVSANSSEVFLKFRVDEKTRDITVYVIDRATKRVVRSIPPEELNSLQAGDLLELLA